MRLLLVLLEPKKRWLRLYGPLWQRMRRRKLLIKAGLLRRLGPPRWQRQMWRQTRHLRMRWFQWRGDHWRRWWQRLTLRLRLPCHIMR